MINKTHKYTYIGFENQSHAQVQKVKETIFANYVHIKRQLDIPWTGSKSTSLEGFGHVLTRTEDIYSVQIATSLPGIHILAYAIPMLSSKEPFIVWDRCDGIIPQILGLFQTKTKIIQLYIDILKK